MDITRLRQIISDDPAGAGYATLSDEAIAAHLTARRLYTERNPEVPRTALSKLLAARGKLIDLIDKAAAGNLKARPIVWVIERSDWDTVNVDLPTIRGALQMAADDPALLADHADLEAVLALADVPVTITANDVARARRADDGTPLIEGHR